MFGRVQPSAGARNNAKLLNSLSQNNFYEDLKLPFSAREPVRSQDGEEVFLNRISSEVEARIIEMWFQGFTRDEISRALKVGGGTVSAVVNSLPVCLKPLRDLSRTLRKLNLLPNDALKGVNLLQLLTERGVTPEQIPISLEAIRKTSIEAGYEPENVIQASIKIADLENQSGKTYPEALKEFEKLTQQIPPLKQEKLQLQLETKENRRLRNETLEQAKTTPQELSEFFDCKTALRRHGMNINDAKTVRKVLDNIKEANGNPKHVVSLIKKHGSISKLVAYFERQLPTKKDELENLLSRIKECQQVILRLQEEKDQLYITINSQRNAINNNNYQLNLILANIAELEKRRQALITWIGKQLNLPQEEIENLRLKSEYEIMLAAVDNALRDASRSCYRQLWRSICGL